MKNRPPSRDCLAARFVEAHGIGKGVVLFLEVRTVEFSGINRRKRIIEFPKGRPSGVVF
jgi:hypothetical protein